MIIVFKSAIVAINGALALSGAFALRRANCSAIAHRREKRKHFVFRAFAQQLFG